MKKIFLGLLLGGLMLGGCSLGGGSGTEKKMEENIVSRTGLVQTQVGDEFLLSTDEGIVNITSNKLDIENYLKKRIKVTGMFSGSTLYVDKIEE